MENNEISKYASSFRGGYDAFSRLFLTELLLSKNIKNCIYFDIDVVVKKNADELFSLVKNIKFIAGVVDSVTIKNGGKWVDDKYINSGVLLMNLENLKSINFVEKCLDFIIEHGKETSLLDQDCINFVLGNANSLCGESFEDSMLEAPIFTKQTSNIKKISNLKLPSEYSKGNHSKIRVLKYELSLCKTKYFRPDIYQRYQIQRGNNAK